MKLHYSEWKPKIASNRPSIVFLHGMGGTGAIWRPIAAQLEDEFRCIALDQRGHGLSRPVIGPTANQWTALDYAQDVLDTIRTLNLESMMIVGHSMGARTALGVAELWATESAQSFQEQVRHVVCVDIGLQGSWGGGMGRPLANFLEALPESFPSRAELKAYLTAHCPDPSIAQYLIAVAKNTAPASSAENWGFPFDHRAIVETIHQANLGANLGENSKSKLADWALRSTSLDVPVTFLRGQNSKVWSASDYSKQKAKFESPNFRFEEWENCGHGLPFEQRARFVAWLRSNLA
jgi:pimeloyl-ACP methyl ester carboxylesterase